MSKTKKKSTKKINGIRLNNSVVKFGIFIIILVVIFISLLFYGRQSLEKEKTKDDYNGFKFYFDANQKAWFTQIQIGKVPYTIPFHFHPIELEDIVVEDNVENIILLNRPENIIIAVPPDSSSQIALAGIEISKLTGERFQVLNIPTRSAVNEPVEGLPLATCDDANQKTVVISMKRSNKNLVSSKGRCIVLEFKVNESLRVADAFVYHLIKIM